jgi:hypothetical protein
MSVFNGARFLAAAVESILTQSFRDFELIAIDDGSQDSTGQILDSYTQDPRVRVFHQENAGLIESLNRGCRLARGVYIARMDGDDIAVKNRLELQVEFMDAHPNVGVLGGAVEAISVDGRVLAVYANPETDVEIRGALKSCSPFWHPTVMMRTETVLAVGGYRGAVAEAEDYDLWLRIAERTELANLNSILLQYRLHSNQVSVSRRSQQILSSLAARAAAEVRKNGGLDPLETAESVNEAVLARLGVSPEKQQTAIASEHIWTIRNLCDTGEYLTAFTMLTKLKNDHAINAAGRRTTADFHAVAARIYWHQRRPASALFSMSRAIAIRPLVAVSAIKSSLQKRRWREARVDKGLTRL